MSFLTIQGPAERGLDPQRFDVPEGGNGTFGSCACGRCDLDIRITAGPALHFRGVLTAGPSVWWVTNLADREPLFVADVDHAGSTTVRPGERLPFGFDMAVVRPLRAVESQSVTVFASALPAVRPRTGHCPEIGPDDRLYLDPNARYFAVLEILCRPRPAGATIPTSADIAAELDISPRAVDAHVDYLVVKFGIPAPTTRCTGWKRSALIAHLRTRDFDVLRRGRVVRSA